MSAVSGMIALPKGGTMKTESFTVRLPLRDSAALEILTARLKLQRGVAFSKAKIIRELVSGFLDGRFKLDAFEGLDVATIIQNVEKDTP